MQTQQGKTPRNMTNQGNISQKDHNNLKGDLQFTQQKIQNGCFKET